MQTGKVKLAFHKDTSMKVAVKIVSKEVMSQKPNMRKKLDREIAIMKLISHPSVLRFLDVYETTKFLYAYCSTLILPRARALLDPASLTFGVASSSQQGSDDVAP